MTDSKKIVFTTWGSFGDIHPFMALARELQARGHRAAIATLSWYREKIEAAGIQFYQLRPDELSTMLRGDGTRTACDVIEGVLDDVAVGQATRQRRERVAFRRFAYDAI